MFFSFNLFAISCRVSLSRKEKEKYLRMNSFIYANAITTIVDVVVTEALISFNPKPSSIGV